MRSRRGETKLVRARAIDEFAARYEARAQSVVVAKMRTRMVRRRTMRGQGARGSEALVEESTLHQDAARARANKYDRHARLHARSATVHAIIIIK